MSETQFSSAPTLSPEGDLFLSKASDITHTGKHGTS